MSESLSLSPPVLNSLFSGPHSGYHWRGQTSRFFEVWYFRVTFPAMAQTFALMYSIDDPAGLRDHSGGAAQILGPNESYYCRTLPDAQLFWAWPHQLGLGHWRSAKQSLPSQHLDSDDFFHHVQEGYQVCGGYHQGKLLNPSGEVQAEWDYSIKPATSWGIATQLATAGWLSYLPVFEPGWQVLLAHGLASGWINWQGQRYEFADAPAYAEKNWGGAFPSKWFWIQCNAFKDAPALSITAVGGMRDVLSWQENVGMVGIHNGDRFYEFISTKTSLTWRVEPWGRWYMSAQDYRYHVEITGYAPDQGAYVRVPTLQGLQWQCRDTTHGRLHVKLWTVEGELLIDSVSELAGLEVGGGPWHEPWCRN